eukprot:GHRR01033412.1.p1 GENE.GHRR01033412.1~~GHRR01033412.1.p1  ORF type:complete len:368 (-),score=119.54 GHRR01033412.1:197-1300(-)
MAFEYCDMYYLIQLQARFDVCGDIPDSMMTASRSSQRSNDVSSINATMQPDIIARQLRDQSFPEPGASTAQPFTTFSCRGAVITTAGPSSSSSPRCGSPVAMPGDIAPTRDSSSAFSPQPHSPLTAGTLSFPASDVSAAADASSRSVHQVPDAPAVKTPDESKHSQQQPYSAAVPGGKRAAAQQLQAVDSMAATAAGGSSHLLSKRQVLDHYQPQQQQEQQQLEHQDYNQQLNTDSNASKNSSARISSASGMPLANNHRSSTDSGSSSNSWQIDPKTGRRKTGVSVGLMVGGIAEMFMIRKDHERIKLKDRKGFVRIALEHGTDILPVYMFGANQVLNMASINCTGSAWTLHAFVQLTVVRMPSHIL